MANDTLVDGLSPVTKKSDGKIVSFPDVCKTPTPTGPVPIPYPNIAQSSDLEKGSKSVKINGSSVCLSSSNISKSIGDEAGSIGGVVSGKTGGKAFPLNYSFDVKIEGKSVVRNTDIFTSNNKNTPPSPIMQSQPTVAMTGSASGEDEKKEDEEKKYNITIGSHLDGPNDLIGHAFISLEYPEGVKITKGFWPDGGFDLARKPDRKGVVFGMDGILLNDSAYLHKKTGLSATKTFNINEKQAKAALKVIKRYEDKPPKYRLLTNQCASFAMEVLRATGNNVKAGIPARPTVIYETLSGKKL